MRLDNNIVFQNKTLGRMEEIPELVQQEILQVQLRLLRNFCLVLRNVLSDFLTSAIITSCQSKISILMGKASTVISQDSQGPPILHVAIL